MSFYNERRPCLNNTAPNLRSNTFEHQDWIIYLTIFLCVIEAIRQVRHFIRTANFLREMQERFDSQINALKKKERIKEIEVNQLKEPNELYDKYERKNERY